MKSVAIVQARWGSSRLSGKVLHELAGASVLNHVLARCAAIPRIDAVCCAVSDDADSDPVAAEAARCGAIVTRGSRDDVLARYLAAARATGAEIVLRVTSDCPLIDPTVCNEVLALRAADGLDYACNNMPPSWPHGLDCEAFTRTGLERAAAEAHAPDEREHVTPWLRRAPGLRRGNLAGPGGDAVRLRWTLDYPEDETFLRQLFAYLPPLPDIAPYTQVLDILAAHPELMRENRHRIDEARLAGADQPAQEANA